MHYYSLFVYCHELAPGTLTVLPANSDSHVMFCLQSYESLRIDISFVYWSHPQDRINTQVIYRYDYAQVKCTC